MMPHPSFMKDHHNKNGLVGNNQPQPQPPGFMNSTLHPPGMMMHHHLPHGGLMRPPPPSPQMMMPAPGMHHRHHPSRPIPFGRVVAENLRPEEGGVGGPVGNDDDNHQQQQQQHDDNNIDNNVVTPHRDNVVNPRRVSLSPFVPAP
jgi:hypothetical protein